MISDIEWDSNPNCEHCKADRVQRKVSHFGCLAMYCLWWCGVGVFVWKLTMFDYCENCFYVHFMRQARARKTFSLAVDDGSLLEVPPVDAAEMRKKIDEHLLIR
ncbi:unnamed protein product [Caenorhabditis sp. 36 PRJEB53466]|nr:unnamed protein product [Caenorhabditis sp. 36 PRJEB53466]